MNDAPDPIQEIEPAPTPVWEQFARQVGIPRRLRGATLRAPARATPALERVAAYLVSDFSAGRCLVLTGPTGVGKSWAAAAAIRATSTVVTPVSWRRFWHFPALCGALLNPATRGEALEHAKATPFVVLDDFGAEYVKEGGLIDAFLDELVWTREAEEQATIITTNLTTDALKARLPERLIDRLRGDWGRIYECLGESLRRPGD